MNETEEISVNYTETDKSWDMPAMHYHDSYEIYILKKGSRNYIINDIVTELRAHDTVLIKPNEFHSTAGGSHTRYLISFHLSYLEKYFTQNAQNRLLACFEQKKIHVKETDFEKLLRLTNKLAQDTDDFVSAAQILLLLQKNMNTEIDMISEKNKMFSDILEYIGSQYKSITGLDEIAERFYISKHYLCRLFKAHTGVSVMKYIQLLKIQKACEMLIETSLSVEKIALMCGFHTSMYFCRTFKELVGKTPSKYREENDTVVDFFK